MKTNVFALRGNIIYAASKDSLIESSCGFLICQDGKVVGVFDSLPDEYRGIPVTDYGDKLIIPGLVDLHLHGPQYAFRGIGMDLELLPWLQTYTFPEESKYSDLDYADIAYDKFVQDLLNSATTRASVYGTMHKDATLMLMNKLEASGLKALVGKVNMNRNSIEGLTETTESSISDTQKWLEQCSDFVNVAPILTPRFIPSCTNDLMAALEIMRAQYDLPVQSHLSENTSECAWVQELHPTTQCYADAYDKYGMFDNRTIMAHCVYSSGREMDLLADNGVFVAHCPDSNANLSSGIAPIRTMIDRGINVGLGSDIAGGAHLSIFYAMAEAIKQSKLRWVYVDKDQAPLSTVEAFYLGTKGGGMFFGKVGSFEPDYAFDAVVIDDSNFDTNDDYRSLSQRLERIIYLSDDRNIVAKYVAGSRLI